MTELAQAQIKRAMRKIRRRRYQRIHTGQVWLRPSENQYVSHHSEPKGAEQLAPAFWVEFVAVCAGGWEDI